MIGLVLNEEGYVTYPYEIFKHIEEYVKALNWRITYVECGGDGSNYVFPFEHQEDYFVDGETLMTMLREQPGMQWWWGTLSGFQKDVSWDEIRKNPIFDIQLGMPYLENTLHHLQSGAVLEVIAFDSSETYVLTDDPNVAAQLISAFPKAENLEQYVFRTET